ncbi:hypothetical protein DLREEDagrD3_28590 [Denitratisoma sp. agr-D3]
MRKTNRLKKAAQEDWHSADIVAALRKAGWSLRKLSIHHGYKDPSTLKRALQVPWPKGQKLIAEAIEVAPQTIWPTRYKGTTNEGAGNSLVTDLRAAA